MVYISGSIGYTLLENKSLDKIILVMSDIHSKLPYCKNGIDIDKWLNKNINGKQIIIEEVPREGAYLHELWDKSPHTQGLKNFVLDKKYTGKVKLDNIKLMDIRPYLKPFSWEIYLNEKYKKSNTLNKTISTNPNDNITFKQYCYNIDCFFLLTQCSKTFPFLKKVHHYIKNILKNKTDGKTSSGIFSHYQYLSHIYENLKNEFILLKDKTIKNMVEEKKLKPLIKFNLICSMIIEWYSILQTFETSQPSIIHTGLAHSERIIEKLIKYYNFKKIKGDGVNTIEVANNNNNIVSCINLPEEIETKFRSKSFLDYLFIF